MKAMFLKELISTSVACFLYLGLLQRLNLPQKNHFKEYVESDFIPDSDFINFAIFHFLF